MSLAQSRAVAILMIFIPDKSEGLGGFRIFRALARRMMLQSCRQAGRYSAIEAPIGTEDKIAGPANWELRKVHHRS